MMSAVDYVHPAKAPRLWIGAIGVTASHRRRVPTTTIHHLEARVPRQAATHLMFEGDASSAMELYAATFPSFRVGAVERYGPGDGSAAGTVKRADASLAGHALIFIDSPVSHGFTFTPSVSLFVDCESAGELDAAFAALSAGGKVYMPLGDYGFSTRFGWCSDRFGVSWQLNLP